MRHIIFEPSSRENYDVAILIKGSAFTERPLQQKYVDALRERGIDPTGIIAFTLAYNDSGKAPASLIKEYLNTLLKALDSLGVKYLYVVDTPYFKTLTGKSKAEPHYGYPLPCKIKGYEHMTVVLGISHQQLIYNPDLQQRLDLTLDTLTASVNGTYQELGSNVIHYAHYPDSVQDIRRALQSLHKHAQLTCDIETFSLHHHGAGIGSIAFAWNQHEGISFTCDYKAFEEPSSDLHGRYSPINPIRAPLREFFESFQGTLIFHNATFDIKCLIYALWMHFPGDTEGLLRGLEVLTRNFEDTRIIAYLATNTTAGNQLGLKHLAHEFAGNWAVEVTDIRRTKKEDLLRYNLVDTLSTWFVYNKYVPLLIQDNQHELYEGLFKDSLRLIIQMELTGMPMSVTNIAAVRKKLEDTVESHLTTINNHGLVKALNLLLQESAMETANARLKTKQHPLEKFADVVFNPNSTPQMQRLLYEVLGLPVLDRTDSGAPATGAGTLEKLIHHVQDPSHKQLLQAIIGYGKADKILNTFIPAFEQGYREMGSDTSWLHGSFNLGGTVSGRLSSSDPNLQNIPAGSDYGELVKTCFKAPDGWIFAGADFNSLEDYISALTTKDPNKLRVYEEGFDGHCLRAAFYFREQLPHIDINDPKSVNSIKETHPELRQESKTPTFALTYAGTYHTLMANLGWSEERAKQVEAAYHEMYKVSDEYVQERLKKATQDGFVEVAFGLRVRTPLLKQVVWKSPKMPHEAAAEGRTAGNALGQSYGLLNNRAAVEFFKKVWRSPYRLDILPVALIHDAIYILIRNNVSIVQWANKELIDCMKWQELPELQHPTVKLGAELDLFWPTWATATTLPNDADNTTIWELCQKTKMKVEGLDGKTSPTY